MSERLDSSARQSQETTFPDPGPQTISGQSCQGDFGPLDYLHAKVLIHNSSRDSTTESRLFSTKRIMHL